MAGAFGLTAANYRTSLAAGRAMLAEAADPAVAVGSTECSACRLQMEDGSSKRTLHPAHFLALAYGLVPAIERRLREPLGDLLTR
jgi:Fe-S oxidoreductase